MAIACGCKGLCGRAAGWPVTLSPEAPPPDPQSPRPQRVGDDKYEDGRSFESVGESDREDGDHDSCLSDADEWAEGASLIDLWTGEVDLEEFF